MSKTLTRFREKFPGYAGIPDRELVPRLGRQAPGYLMTDPDFRAEFDRFQRGEQLRLAQDVLEAEPDPTIRGQLGKIAGDVAGQVVLSAGGVLASPLEAVARTAEALESRFPTFGPSQAEDMLTFKAAEAIRRGASSLAGEIDPEVAESFMLGKVPSGLGSTAGFLAGGAAGKALKVPSMLALASLGASAGGVEGYRRAKFAGADDETAFKSFLANSAVGLTEIVPLSGMLNRLNRASGNALGRALIEGTEETLQESFQALSGNKIAQVLTDEDVTLLSDVVESGGAGALTGFLTSLLISAVGGRRAGQVSTEAPPQTGQALTGSPVPAEAAIEPVQPVLSPASEEAEAVPDPRTSEAQTVIVPAVGKEAPVLTADPTLLAELGPPVETVEQAVEIAQTIPVEETEGQPVESVPETPPESTGPTDPDPSPYALGFAFGAVPRAFQRFIDRYAPVPAGDPPPVNIDTSTIAPDFQPYDVSQQVANRPNGLGRVRGLGWLFDPRAIAGTPVERGIITRAFEVTVGKALASSLGQEIKGSIDGAFKREGSLITNVEAQPGTPLHIADFFEQLQVDPSVYNLTPDQQAAADAALKILGEIQSFQERNEIAPGQAEGEESDRSPVARAYFPRQRVFTQAEKKEFGTPQGRGQAVGAKQGFQKSRLFESEAQGVLEGRVTYEPSIEKRLVTVLERSYRVAADKRLANNPDLAGETIKEREAKYLAQFAQDIADGYVSRETVLEIARTPRPDERRVFQPAFAAKIFPREVGDALNKAYGQTTSDIRRRVAKWNSNLKSLGFGIDFAAPVLQGQVLLFYRPDRWAKATWNHFKAFFRSDVMTRLLSTPDNRQAMQELAQLGVPIGTLQDFVAGLGEEGGLGRIPVIGPGFQRFARSFQTFNEVAMLEMWKAWREVTPRAQWPAVAETIQFMLMRGRLEEIGISQGQAMLERVVLLAPSYLRGSVNLIGSLNSPGVSGQIARRALGAWLMGGTLAMIAGGIALGLDDDEIEERLNPMSSDFGMLPVTFPDGRVRNIGLGGSLRSIMRLFGEITESVLKGDGRLGSPGMDNPLIRWVRGKFAPVPAFVSDAYLGEDFLGNEITFLEALRARTLPLIVQQFWTRPGEPPASVGDIAPNVLGFQVWPEGINKTMLRESDKLAQARGYTDYNAAPLRTQIKIHTELKRRPEFVKPESSPRQIELALEADVRRRERLRSALPKRHQDQFERLQLRISGYDSVLNFGRNTTLPLTKSQQARYEALIVARYEQALDRVPWDRLELLEPSVRQDIIYKVLGEAKKAARGQLLKEMTTEP